MMYQLHQEQHSYALRLAELKLKHDSWVMKSPSEGFVKLPNERILFTSPPRTSLNISTPNPYPGSQPYTVKHDSGVAYITNQRVVFLPVTPTADLQSFSSPILNLQDTHVRAPFFGANYWTGSCKPVAGGGIPETHSVVEVKITFKEGGAFDFHSTFEQIKERVHQAYSVARENGQGGAVLSGVHLEQLPAYEANPDAPKEANEPVIHALLPRRGSVTPTTTILDPVAAPLTASVPTPDEPPPGYEEAQAHR
ncbi:hypothetical protein BJ878DRAFT_262588 [Calycina marina]|uniref:Uncharacterized protein n=1 Tax=Calycina marina TaxID=1763456 RepID=A0A9P8CBF7_9HELO|nr:hypothetical protein BJ878DRAFT_262588 [Calycina marina]